MRLFHGVLNFLSKNEEIKRHILAKVRKSGTHDEILTLLNYAFAKIYLNVEKKLESEEDIWS